MNDQVLYTQNNQGLRKLVFVSILLALVVVALGAYTRLTHAGLGCPDWPTCYGLIDVPETAEQIAKAELAYPDRQVEPAKAWNEMIHRYFAGTLGLLILAIAFLSIKNRGQGTPLRLPLLILVIVIFQAALGMWTVTMLLKPAIVTLHLLGGMLTLALLWWTTLTHRMTQNKKSSDLIAPKNIKIWALFALFIVYFQIALGGWTSSNYAGLACPDFPTCQNQWFPKMELAASFNLTDISEHNYTGGLLSSRSKVTIHVIHRITALILFVSIITLLLQMWQSPPLKQQAKILLGLTLLQITLGIANAVLMLPLPLALAHNTVAALLLLNVVYINFLLLPRTTPVVIKDNAYAHQTIT